MELLYVWINYSEYGVFKNQEVLLCDEYNICFNLEERRIDIFKNEGYYNIFANN